MTDYPVFAKAFKESGGSHAMARHLWSKWKDTHNDDFLAEYGNMDIQNQRITAKMVNKLIKLHRDKASWKKYNIQADAEYIKRQKLGKVI